MKGLLAGLLAILVQFGLAILGRAGFAAFFSHPPVIAMAAVTLVVGAAALFSGGNLSPGVREDRGNPWVIAAFSMLAILLAFFPHSRTASTFGPSTASLFAGRASRSSPLVGVLRLWPVFVLGRRFSGLVAIQTDHELVATGIYRHIRNPSYLGLLVGSVGWALKFRAGLGVVIAALLLIPLLARIRSEVRLLADKFGAEFESYRARTWRLLPGIY